MFVRRGATGGEGAQRGRPVSGADVLLCFKLPCAVDPRDGLDNGGGKMWIHKNGREGRRTVWQMQQRGREEGFCQRTREIRSCRWPRETWL